MSNKKNISLFIVLIALYFAFSVIYRVQIEKNTLLYCLYHCKESILLITLSIFIIRRSYNSLILFSVGGLVIYQSIKMVTIIAYSLKSLSMLEVIMYIYNPYVSLGLSILAGGFLLVIKKLTTKRKGV